MSDIKLFVKSEKQIENLIQITRVISRDLSMEFCIENCVMLIMWSKKKKYQKEYNTG